MDNLLGLPPALLIVIVSAAIALVSTLVYKYMTDQNLIKTLRADIKKYQLQMREHKTNPEKVMEIQKQMMPMNTKLMMQTMKPTIITIIPFILVFNWLRGMLNGIVIIPATFHVPMSGLPTGLGWLGTYFICSIVFTTLLRKLFKVV